MARQPDPLTLIAGVVEEGTARSRLSRWLTRNHDEFARMMEQGANWTSVTEAFVKSELVRPGAKPSATKRAWERVKVRVAVSRANAARRPASAPVRPAPAPANAGARPPPTSPNPALQAGVSDEPKPSRSRADEQIAASDRVHASRKTPLPPKVITGHE